MARDDMRRPRALHLFLVREPMAKLETVTADALQFRSWRTIDNAEVSYSFAGMKAHRLLPR
jgi:hypothetical protein